MHQQVFEDVALHIRPELAEFEAIELVDHLLEHLHVEAEAQGEEVGQGDISDPTEAVDGGTLAMQVATQDVLYVVQTGDSLGSLALRFYGDADLNTAIFKANRQVLDSPESLRPGVKLLIPARSGL